MLKMRQQLNVKLWMFDSYWLISSVLCMLRICWWWWSLYNVYCGGSFWMGPNCLAARMRVLEAASVVLWEDVCWSGPHQFGLTAWKASAKILVTWVELLLIWRLYHFKLSISVKIIVVINQCTFGTQY